MAFDFHTGQVSCTESPQRLSTLSDSFFKVIISNVGTATAYIGGEGVSVTGGFALPHVNDNSITFDLYNTGELYGGSYINTLYAVGAGAIVTWMALK